MFIVRCLNTISLFLQSLIQVVSENGTCTCKEYLNTNKLSVLCTVYIQITATYRYMYLNENKVKFTAVQNVFYYGTKYMYFTGK